MIDSKKNIVPPGGKDMEEALLEQRRRLMEVQATPRPVNTAAKTAVEIGVAVSLTLMGVWMLYMWLF